MSGIRRRQDHRFLWMLLTAVCMMSGSCNMREPGCLDVEAANFDFEADKHDQSLCVYPNLILNVLYAWTDSTLQTGYLYRNSFGTDYAVHGVQLLFSGFKVRNTDALELNIDQRLQVTVGTCDGGNVVEIPDDFVFADRSKFNYIVGAFRQSGVMNQFGCTVGLNDDYTPVCLESLPASHPLAAARAGYDEDLGEFALGRFILSRDSVNAARDTFFVYGPSEELQFDVLRTFTQGKPDTVYMSIDFFTIFDQVDLNMDHDAIANALSGNISSSISLR